MLTITMQITYSNTTLVKVKLWYNNIKKEVYNNSNTTLVKVKLKEYPSITVRYLRFKYNTC